MPARGKSKQLSPLTVGDVDSLLQWAIARNYPPNMVDALLDTRNRIAKNKKQKRRGR